MEAHRQEWNQQHKELNHLLTRPPGVEDPAGHHRAVDLFLRLHAPLHAAQAGNWSPDAELWQGMADETARRIPRGEEHSVVWAIWHIARIEDITMNYLVAGTPQIFARLGWREKLSAAACDTGNAMDPAAIARLSVEMDLPALRAYRAAVGERTREILQALAPGALAESVDPAALAQIAADGAVVPEAAGLLEYWGSKTKGSLLLMPPTRHNLIHLNEALDLKAKRA